MLEELSLDKIWKRCYSNLVDDTNQQLEKVFSYEENGRYIEYTEGYGIREKLFSDKMKEILSQPDFKKFFIMVHSAYYSSNSIDQFKHLLSRFLARLVSKKYGKYSI